VADGLPCSEHLSEGCMIDDDIFPINKDGGFDASEIRIVLGLTAS
jgi:hypothetical protein